MNNIFGERLKELREEKKLSQAGLSLELGLKISSSAISFYEIGKREPSLSAAIEFAKYFGVSLDYLAGLED